MDCLFDKRGDCMSIAFTISYSEYKELIDHAYKNRGGIDGQRGTLKTSTAIRIRKRMVEDITKGTILPPLVIGAAVKEADYNEFEKKNEEALLIWLKENASSLSLIDGMQRTTAMFEAEKSIDLSEYKIRIELWLAHTVNNLIHRMLVLISGQVPWDVRRQLETVFGSIVSQLQMDLPELSIFTEEESRRRAKAGQYQANRILELYLAFGSRKKKIDIKERLSDEFVRLDFLELTSDTDSTLEFEEALRLMTQLDRIFERVDAVESERFKSGTDVFGSQPACVGFIVATSILMLGRPGSSQSKESLEKRWSEKKAGFNSIVEKAQKMNKEELTEFLALQTLSEKLAGRKSGKVGDFEREFFRTAFSTLYDEGEDLTSFEVCWNAY